MLPSLPSGELVMVLVIVLVPLWFPPLLVNLLPPLLVSLFPWLLPLLRSLLLPGLVLMLSVEREGSIEGGSDVEVKDGAVTLFLLRSDSTSEGTTKSEYMLAMPTSNVYITSFKEIVVSYGQGVIDRQKADAARHKFLRRRMHRMRKGMGKLLVERRHGLVFDRHHRRRRSGIVRR